MLFRFPQVHANEVALVASDEEAVGQGWIGADVKAENLRARSRSKGGGIGGSAE